MVATKTQALDKQKALQILNQFFDQFKICCNQKQAPKAADFERLLSQDFQNSSNGKLIGRSLQDFLKRIQDLQKRYSHIEINRIQDCLVSGNKAVMQYDASLTLHDGKNFLLNIMAIATIDEDRITHWSQVSHDKNRDHLSSQ